MPCSVKAYERQYRFLEAECTLQLRTDRRNHVPYGLAGGRPRATF